MPSIYSCPLAWEDRERKTRFATREWADNALDKLWREAVDGSGPVRDKLPCRSYYCKECFGYHLTSQAYPYSTGEFPPLELERSHAEA